MKSWFSPATAFCYISRCVSLISLSFLDWQLKGVSPPWNTAGRSSSCGNVRQTSARLTCQKVKLGIRFILLPEVNKVSSRLLQLLGLFPALCLCVSPTLAFNPRMWSCCFPSTGLFSFILPRSGPTPGMLFLLLWCLFSIRYSGGNFSVVCLEMFLCLSWFLS